MSERFTREQIDAARKSMIVGIRAGTKPHRVIGVWGVVVEGRLFIRSWSVKPNGWYRVFAGERRGVVEIGGESIPVRAVHTRSERIKDEVDRAYALKYHTPASLRYVRDLCSPKSRETTTELVPSRSGK